MRPKRCEGAGLVPIYSYDAYYGYICMQCPVCYNQRRVPRSNTTMPPHNRLGKREAELSNKDITLLGMCVSIVATSPSTWSVLTRLNLGESQALARAVELVIAVGQAADRSGNPDVEPWLETVGNNFGGEIGLAVREAFQWALNNARTRPRMQYEYDQILSAYYKMKDALQAFIDMVENEDHRSLPRVFAMAERALKAAG